ncbi:S-layer homology domain-containing protein [Paenibacillus sp. 481]|uniref:S-layer homology domain-containing protein n=1 Tax=Paenibacillus sp. 481 TaxID=2835869 RepID=UPI001E3CC6FA|nr:S-layer homology domain-containing protein [Paenibacillus sp. 481]UHA73028.1 S-layer homology domain-containing protein [Paenibacillus sp. 481]
MQLNQPKRTRSVQKWGSALLAVSLTIGTAPTVFAAEPSKVSGTKTQSTKTTTTSTTTSTSGVSPVFNDVKLGFWAEKHIHKLAALGILQGNNGKFRPNDPVTQQEAVTMAIRFMGLEGELQTGDNASLPKDFKVGNYFKPYIVLAFKEGLLTKEEELLKPDPKKPWGDQKASREWVTKILVRAVKKQDDALKSMTKQTTFADNSKISASARGYVNAAVDLKLATGMAGNKFEPLKEVTRAQMATFFSRGESVTTVKHAAERYGYVMALSDQELRLYGEDGQTETYRHDKNTMIYRTDGDKQIVLKDLGLYMKVRIIGRNSVATYVELVDAEPKVDVSESSVKYVAPSESKIYLKHPGREDLEQLVFNKDTVIKDAGGNVISASQITPESTIVIKRETFSQERKVIELQVKSGPVNKSTKGTLTEIDTPNRKVTIQPESGAKETFTVAEDAVIRYQNKLMANGLKDLKLNSVINYTVKNSIVTNIELTSVSEMMISGVLFDKGANRTSITVKQDNNNLETKMLAHNFEIVLEGMNNPSFDELVAGENGDRVELTLNSENQVTRIKLVNRKVEMLLGVQVVSFDKQRGYLTVEVDKQLPRVFVINGATRIENNGSKLNIDELASMLNEKRKANIQYSGSNAIAVQFVHKTEGTFMYTSAAANTLTLKLVNGQTVTIPMRKDLSYVEIYGKTNAKLADISNGQHITVHFEDDQKTVRAVSVRTNEQFEVESVDTNNGRVRFRTNSNTIEEFYVGTAPVKNMARELVKLSDVRPNEYYNVVMDGRTVVEMSRSSVVYGTIDSLDTSKGVMMVKDSAGQMSIYQVGTGTQILVDNSSTTNLNAIKVGDRVEVRKDIYDKTIIRHVKELKRTFWKHDSRTNEVYVKRSMADTSFIFKLHPNAYVHQKGQKINVSSLQDNSDIVLYVIKDQVVEIEKVS